MADRLRASLSSYFSRHMQRGDWCGALRALRGCAETGTLLRSLPHDTLFPFLVARGQWEAVLRLSSQLIVAEDQNEIEKKKKKKGKGWSGGSNDVDTKSSLQEESLMNTLLSATLADEAVANMGSWQAAVVIVQRTAQRRVRLETSVLQNMLRAVETWQREVTACCDAMTEETQRCSDVLLLTRDILVADLCLRAKPLSHAATNSSLVEAGFCSTPPVVQEDLVKAIYTAVLQELPGKNIIDNKTHWLKLMEQLRASFALSWKSAVRTVLSVCAPRGDCIADENIEFTDDILQTTIDYITVRPCFAERVLNSALEHMFNSVITACPSSNLCRCDSNAVDIGSKNFPCVEWWEKRIEKNAALELPKWEAVKALTIAATGQRERNWEMVCDIFCKKCDPEELRAEMLSVERLCLAARLLYLTGGAPVQKEYISGFDDMNFVDIRNVVRKLLLHGSVVCANGGGNVIAGIVTGTIQALMSLVIRVCSEEDCRQAVVKSREVHKRKDEGLLTQEYKSNRIAGNVGNLDNHGCSEGDSGHEKINEETGLSQSQFSFLVTLRNIFWNHVIFPSTVKVPQQLHIYATWQVLLRRVFGCNSLLAMWFNYKDNDERFKDSVALQCGDKESSASTETDEQNSRTSFVFDDKNNSDLGGGGGGGGGGGCRRRLYSFRVLRDKNAFLLNKEALEQLCQLMYFIGRRFVVSDAFEPHYSHLLQGQRQREVQQRPCDISHFMPAERCKTTGLAALSKIVLRQEDVDWIGQALLRACVADDISVADASSVWGTYVTSIARQHVRPLLCRMIDVVSAESYTTRGKNCRVALVVTLHECGMFHAKEKGDYVAALLRSVEPQMDSWHVALLFFREATLAICEQYHNYYDGFQSKKENNSLSHILDALVVRATPPRWQEALQIVEILHELVPSVQSQMNNYGSKTSSSSSAINTTENNDDVHDSVGEGGRDETMLAMTFLSESERIDLYESVAPLKKRQHWMSAIELFISTYEVRRLSAYDAACFDFAVKKGPLAFARRVILAISEENKCRAIAEAALVASALSVGRSLTALRQQEGEQKKNNHVVSTAQERAFVLHEAGQVTRLALAAWPTPITEESDFAFIWKHVKQACAGNVNAARLLLRNSALYNSLQAKAEAESVIQTVRLCATAQDSATAICSYFIFRKRFFGMVLPEETMLQLLELCALSVSEGTDEIATSKPIDKLCIVLKDALWMHDQSSISGNSNTAVKHGSFLKICKAVFQIDFVPFDKRATDVARFCFKIPLDMRQHLWRVLKVFVKHIVDSPARLLRDLSDMVCVMRALPLQYNSSVAEMSLEKDKTALTFSYNPISMLLHQVQRVKEKLGLSIQVDCLFWLGILQQQSRIMTQSLLFLSQLPKGQGGDDELTLLVPRWDPAIVLNLNNETNHRDTRIFLDYIIFSAVELTSRQQSESCSIASSHSYVLSPSSPLRHQLLLCVNEALVFLLQHCWHAHPPLVAILAAAECAISHMQQTSNWMLSGLSMEALASLHSILNSFYVAHVQLKLAAAANPGGCFLLAVDARLSSIAQEAMLCTREFLNLAAMWMQTLLDALGDGKGHALNSEHVHFMIRSLGSLMGTSASWPGSTLKDDCMREIRRLCEGLQRCLQTHHVAASLSRSAIFLLRVMYAIFQVDSLSNKAVELLFRTEAFAAFRGTGGCMKVDKMCANDSFFSDILTAITLVHIVGCGPPQGLCFVAEFLLPFLLHEGQQESSCENEAFICGLVAIQSAIFGSTDSVLRAFHPPLQTATRFLTHLLKFDSLSSLLNLAPAFVFLSEEKIVEMTVFAALAECRRRGGCEAPGEREVTDAMDAVAAAAPRRWDLTRAVALGLPLTSVAGGTGWRLLRERLSFGAQCCGTWPAGALLSLLLTASFSPVLPDRANKENVKKNLEDGLLPDYLDWLKDVTNIDATKRVRSMPQTFIYSQFMPLSLCSSSYTLQLLRYVLEQHRCAFTAASIILGNAVQQRQEQQQQQQKQQKCDVLDALCSTDDAVQFTAILCATISLMEEVHYPRREREEQEQLLSKLSSWLLCPLRTTTTSSSASLLYSPSSALLLPVWPWELLCEEAKQLLLCSRAAFTPPLYKVLEGKVEEEKVKKKQSIITAALSLVTLPCAGSFYSATKTRSLLPASFFSDEGFTNWNDNKNKANNLLLRYPQALFNTAWVVEMLYTRKIYDKHHVEFFRLCNDLRVFSGVIFTTFDNNDNNNNNDNNSLVYNAAGAMMDIGHSLLAIPSGFSSLQYVYALLNSTDSTVISKKELQFFLTIVCSKSLEDVASALKANLAWQFYLPLSPRSLSAVWNTVLIRSMELEDNGWMMLRDVHNVGNWSAADFIGKVGKLKPLHHDIAAAFIRLALDTQQASFMSFSAQEEEKNEIQKHEWQRLFAEIFVHSAPAEVFSNTNNNDITALASDIDESLFCKACAAVVSTAFSFLKKNEGLGETTCFIDAQVKLALNMIKEYRNGVETAWLSLWPPLLLEMSRARRYAKTFLLRKNNDLPAASCLVRHPVAVSWVMLLVTASKTHRGIMAESIMALFDIFSLYLTTGVASFNALHTEPSKKVKLESAKVVNSNNDEIKDEIGTIVPFVRGAGAGLVVDHFVCICIALADWQTKRRIHHCDWTRENDVIRRFVDALFPRVSVNCSPPSLLSGYSPLSSNALRSLVRLLLLRGGIDKYRTAIVKQVENFLRLEQSREVTRRIAASEASLPLADVHICHPRGPLDINIQLLFFLRAFTAALTFINPLGWHSERQASLDIAYTALMDFLQLYTPAYGDVVDITSRAVVRELESVFGTSAMRVISASSLSVDTDENVGGNETVTLKNLYCFLSGNWRCRLHHNRDTLFKKRRSNFQKELRELFAKLKHAAYTEDVLLVEGDNISCTDNFSLIFTKIISVTQGALLKKAATPSSAITFEILDAAILFSAAEKRITAARCGLNFFVVIAPYVPISTLLLEKVLLLLVIVLQHSGGADGKLAQNAMGERENDRLLCKMILKLVLCRFQYVPLKTPTAVVLLCQLYALASTFTTNNTVYSYSCQKFFSISNETLLQPPPSPPPPLISKQQREWLLWRCAVEANGVAQAPLEAALLYLRRREYLEVLKHGCLEFLLQDHTKLHYDPPFLRLGRLIDVVLCQLSFSEGQNNSVDNSLGIFDDVGGGGSSKNVSSNNNDCNNKSFTAQLLHMLEASTTAIPTTTTTTSATTATRTAVSKPSPVPWRRVVQFLSHNPESDGKQDTKIMRIRFHVALLSQVLLSPGEKKDTIRQLWKRALSTILPVVFSGDEMNGVSVELKQRATVYAAKVFYIAQPLDQWELALKLTSQLQDSVKPLVPMWSSSEAPLFHVLQYFCEACNVSAIPIASLILYMRHMATRLSAAAPAKNSNADINRAKVVAAFAEKLQRHPYLCWVDALAVLQSMNVVKMSLGKRLLEGNDNHDKKNNLRLGSDAGHVIFQAMGEFATAVTKELFRKHLYEPMLRFVEAVQPHYCFLTGREILACVNHAASVLLPPGPNGGLSEVILLLNGTLVGKTLDDILRERSTTLLQEHVGILRDLLRNGRCGDAAVLVRQSVGLLRTQEFYDTCAGLINRFQHRAIVCFYDELIHPEVEEYVQSDKVKNDMRFEENESGIMTTKLTEENMSRTEDVSFLCYLSIEVLQQAMMAFEVAANSAQGIDNSARRTGLWISAAWMRCISLKRTSIEPLAATLHWVYRDIVCDLSRKQGEALNILADALRDELDSNGGSSDCSGGGGTGGQTLLQLLQPRECAVTRLLVEILSGSFPELASRLCEHLLKREQASCLSISKTNNNNNNTDEWCGFLRCTAAYNAALHQGSQHCRELIESSATNDSGCSAIVEWRDRVLFGGFGCESAEWLSALAAYTASRSCVGHAGVSGAHAARLVRLITISGSLRIVISAARNIFLNVPFSQNHAALTTAGGGTELVPLFLDTLSLFCKAMMTMKRREMHRLSIFLNDAVEFAGLEAILLDLRELNRFIVDSMDQLMQQHQRTSTVQEGALDGRVELASNMIRCLTVALMSSAASTNWRLSVQSILEALPPLQRQGVLLDALMKNLQDSFEVARLIKQNLISSIAIPSDAFSSVWLDALGIVTADKNLRRYLFLHTAADQLKAMGQLEVLLCWASLATDGGVEAMKSLCDVALRCHMVPLTEDAKAVVKMACIQSHGSSWRAFYKRVTGFVPSTVRRGATLSASDETARLRRCEHALEMVNDWAQALFLCQSQREEGVRLKHVHYCHILNLLEKSYIKNDAVTATAMSEAVVALHFARLHDGCQPSTHAVEQSLRILSRAVQFIPLCVMQYAQAITLIPLVSNKRHKNNEAAAAAAADLSLSLSSVEKARNASFSISSVIIRQVTKAAQFLPAAVSQGRITMDEGVEGLRMFASFVRWASDFSRIPCIERDVMEAVVVLLCTMPSQLLLRPTVFNFEKHSTKCNFFESEEGDLRRMLLNSFLVRSEGVTANAIDGDLLLTSPDCYRFTCINLFGDNCNNNNNNNNNNNSNNAVPTFENLCALRSTADAALCFVLRQLSLHNVLPLSNSLLCRMFAAVTAGVKLSASSLEPLSRIAQNTKIITPAMRYVLALVVAEQSVLWGIKLSHVNKAGEYKCKKKNEGCNFFDTPLFNFGKPFNGEPINLPVYVVITAVTKAYDLVKQYFAPPESLMLRGLLLHDSLDTATVVDDNLNNIANNTNSNNNNSSSIISTISSCVCYSDNDVDGKNNITELLVEKKHDNDDDEEEEEDLRIGDEMTVKITWEHALTLFTVFLQNAQPHSDLSMPFAALTALLCQCGKWSLACRNITLAGIPSIKKTENTQLAELAYSIVENTTNNITNNTEYTSHLLSKYVLADCFIIRQLNNTIKTMCICQQKEMAEKSKCGDVQNFTPPQFWRVALSFLQKEQQLVGETFLRMNDIKENGAMISSVTLLAIIKEVCKDTM